MPRIESPREERERKENENIAGLTDESPREEFLREHGSGKKEREPWKLGSSIQKRPIAFIILLAYFGWPLLIIRDVGGMWIVLLIVQVAKAWFLTWVWAAIVDRFRGKENDQVDLSYAASKTRADRELVKEISELTIGELVKEISKIEDSEDLNIILMAEKEGKARKGAVGAIMERIENVSGGAGEDEEGPWGSRNARNR